MESKRCSKCEQVLSLDSFTKNSKRKDGLTCWCKSCNKKSRDRYYQENKESIKNRHRNWRSQNTESIKRKRKEKHKEDPRKTMLYSAKHRAKINGLSFDLELDDIIIPVKCPVFLTDFDIESSTQSRMSPSLDRINPEKGYVKGNVQVISWLANTMKNNATTKELIAFAEWVNKTFKEENG